MTQIEIDGAMRKQVAQRGEKTFYSFFPLSLYSVAEFFFVSRIRKEIKKPKTSEKHFRWMPTTVMQT